MLFWKTKALNLTQFHLCACRCIYNFVVNLSSILYISLAASSRPENSAS